MSDENLNFPSEGNFPSKDNYPGVSLFERIKQMNPYGIEYWSARDLMPLLGYKKWQKFEEAIKRAMTACTQSGNIIDQHFTGAGKTSPMPHGGVKDKADYNLSRFACYLIAQNGDPRKPEIAAAQAYFAISTRENELTKLHAEQEARLEARERVVENNKALNSAAKASGVLSKNFGHFHNAGYKGLYDGRDVAGIKVHKNIDQKEDLLDRMGRAELAANDFRITQTEERLRNQGIIGEDAAIKTHHEVGKEVRKAIENIGGRMPEDLPAEPSIKPLLEEKRRKERKRIKQSPPEQRQSLFDEPDRSKEKP